MFIFLNTCKKMIFLHFYTILNSLCHLKDKTYLVKMNTYLNYKNASRIYKIICFIFLTCKRYMDNNVNTMAENNTYIIY